MKRKLSCIKYGAKSHSIINATNQLLLIARMIALLRRLTLSQYMYLKFTTQSRCFVQQVQQSYFPELSKLISMRGSNLTPLLRACYDMVSIILCIKVNAKVRTEPLGQSGFSKAHSIRHISGLGPLSGIAS